MALFLTIISATFFSWALPYAQTFRTEFSWIYYLMPLLMIPILWDRQNPEDILSTRSEVNSLRTPSGTTLRRVAWVAGVKQIFLTLFAHALGASVGREAVGIQLGGWASRLRSSHAWMLSVCLATGFAIVLGTPFAAAVFIFESKHWRLTWSDIVGIPLIAWIGYRISLLIGVSHSQYQSFDAVYIELRSFGLQRAAIFLALLLLSTIVLCGVFLHAVDRVSRRKTDILNLYIMPLAFLCAVGLVFGSLGSSAEVMGLPGLGVTILHGLSPAEPDTYSISNHPLLYGVLKVFLTAGFVGIGVRGGELTPLLFSGAMVSVGLGAILNLPIAGLVPIGFSLLWGIAARRPITAAIITGEIFGFSNWGSLVFLIAGLVFIGMKLGDALLTFAPRLRQVWRRGLYDL